MWAIHSIVETIQSYKILRFLKNLWRMGSYTLDCATKNEPTFFWLVQISKFGISDTKLWTAHC